VGERVAEVKGQRREPSRRAEGAEEVGCGEGHLGQCPPQKIFDILMSK